jgi:hypothetical protein
MSRPAAGLENLQKAANSARLIVGILRQALTGAAPLESLAIEPLLADAVELADRIDCLRDAMAEELARAEEGKPGQATAPLEPSTSTRECSPDPEEEALANDEVTHGLIACLRGEGKDLAHCQNLVRSAVQELERSHHGVLGGPAMGEARVELRRAADLMLRTVSSTLAEEAEQEA